MIKENNPVQEYDPNYNLLNGLAKGSLWNNLYEPYKYEASTFASSIDNIIKAYKFSIIELELFLDINPNNTKALNDLSKMKSELKKAISYKSGESYVEV